MEKTMKGRMAGLLLLALPVVLTALVYVSCAEGSRAGSGFGEENVPVFFDRQLSGGIARVSNSLTTTDNISEMVVFGYKTTGDWNESTATPDFMYNQTVTRSGGPWSYSPVRYWPSPLSDEKLSFLAAGPAPSATNGISTATTASQAGYPAFTVTPAANPSDQVDFCVAVPVMNTTVADTNGSAPGDGGGKVSFAFDHVMAQVGFLARHIYNYNDLPPEVRIDAIELSGLKGSNTLRFVAGGYSWGTPEGSGVYTLASTRNELVADAIAKKIAGTTATENNKVATTAGTLCLLPQTIPAGTVKIRVEFRMYDITGYTIEGTLPASQWEAGESYLYDFTLDVDGIVWNFGYTGAIETFTAPKDGTYRIEAWGGRGGNVTGSNYGRNGRNGDYARGEIELKKDDVLYICVGSAAVDTYDKTRGAVGSNPGGGNGGFGGVNAFNEPVPCGGSGGAASDVRTSNASIAGIDLDADSTADTRIIIAGGGGGGGRQVNALPGGQTGATGANGGTGQSGGQATNSGHGGGGGGHRGGSGGTGYSQQGSSGTSVVVEPAMSNPFTQANVQNGDGQVRIILLPL
jgi:hypothetical protein